MKIIQVDDKTHLNIKVFASRTGMSMKEFLSDLLDKVDDEMIEQLTLCRKIDYNLDKDAE